MLPAVLVALLLSSAGGDAVSRPTDDALTGGFKSYRDPVSGLAFEYPARYVVHELRAPDQELVSLDLRLSECSAGKSVMRLWVEGEHPRRAGFADGLEFAVHLARLHCDADGPEGGTHCPDVARRVPFATSHGLPAVELHLIEVEERNGKTARRTKPPVLAVDASRPGAPATWLLDLVEPTNAALAADLHTVGRTLRRGSARRVRRTLEP